MSWLEKLYQTYENCSATEELLLPPFHMRNNTHIEIRIDGKGMFIDAKREEIKNTTIPCTEKSEIRTSSISAHPLCDKIQYIAQDYKGSKKSYFDKYIELLGKWATSGQTHPFVNAVYTYVQKGTLLSDLQKDGRNVIEADEDPADLFVRWRVEIPGIAESRCWADKTLFKAWQTFYEQQDSVEGLCMVTGKNLPLAINHPKKVRNSADGGKLISSNDRTGFTFRGRFSTDEVVMNGKKEEVSIQAASVSSEVSQKAHRALSWLIERQGFRNGDQVIISWAVSGKATPPVMTDTLSIFSDSVDEDPALNEQPAYSDAGQTFARKLSKRIAGYHADLRNTENIIVMGLDSAGPGRISITYYRELTRSDFLQRIENWHLQMAWHFSVYHDKKQNKIIWGHYELAPSPDAIAEVCYGTKRDEDFKKFRRKVNERILPCIIDARNVPIDLVSIAIQRASNRLAYNEKEKWQWEQALSVACALYKCYQIRNTNESIKNEYTMALENDRTDRDYLFGRLLAVAEHIEETALYSAGEKRETTAARMMQRFSDFPYPTWRNIESALVPYKSRLQTNRPGVLHKMKNLLDEIHARFNPGDYERQERLSGAYLLGYHCQRMELKRPAIKESNESEE